MQQQCFRASCFLTVAGEEGDHQGSVGYAQQLQGETQREGAHSQQGPVCDCAEARQPPCCHQDLRPGQRQVSLQVQGPG